MLCGIDQLSGNQLAALRKRLRDSRIGVLTHAAAVDRRGRSTLSVLEELGVTPRVIFDTNQVVEASDELRNKLRRLQKVIREHE